MKRINTRAEAAVALRAVWEVVPASRKPALVRLWQWATALHGDQRLLLQQNEGLRNSVFHLTDQQEQLLGLIDELIVDPPG
jgi:hypothetical protein